MRRQFRSSTDDGVTLIEMMVAISIASIKKKSVLPAVFIFLCLLANNVYGNLIFFKPAPGRTAMDQSMREVISVFKARGVEGAYAHCDIGYAISLMSAEKINPYAACQSRKPPSAWL